MRLKRLVIDNFLSYSHAELDFTNIRKALVIGMNERNAASGNNSGKSNLFQAIGWAVWGESKAPTIDENVRWETTECSVEIWFEHNGKDVYIKRTRNSDNGTSNVEFRLDGEDSKSGKSATKNTQKILDFIKIDYLTYVNSVYIRQSDIYSLANPQKANQGREVLEQILKLEVYDDYEKNAKLKVKNTEKSITESVFFIDSNKDVNKKIELVKLDINTSDMELKKNKEKYIGITKELSVITEQYNLRKDILLNYSSLKEQLNRSNSLILSKKSELEKDVLKGKNEVINRETTKSNLQKKIEQKPIWEAARETFLNEAKISDEIKRQINTLEESLAPDKESLKNLQNKLRDNEKSKIILSKDVETVRNKMDEIKNNVKNIKVSAGEKCAHCLTDITENNIELIKKHYKDEYIKNHDKLTIMVESSPQLEKEEKILQDKIFEKNDILFNTDAKIDELRPKIISKKQYEDKLIYFSDKLAEIDEYSSQLLDLPETKIIEMLVDKVKQLKSDIANEETHNSELKKQYETINIDTNVIDKLKTDIEEKQLEMDKLNKNIYTTEANIKNYENKVSEYESVLLELNGRNEVLTELRNMLTVLEQLEKAFGSKGVRAKIIEDSIRELETESNIMLNRLTQGRLSVSFITEREGKIVFDVDVHDGPKTLSYALYAGSEHFRIAFSLRIALAKLLMRKTNSKLDFLLIDEADASLDGPNSEEVINIINELQDDFYTILYISHRTDIKDRFEEVITVYSDGEVSTLV